MSRFEKKLEKQIRTREREIERMCGFHYTNFVEAINELSGIEGDATKLVRKVASTNHDLQELGGKILGTFSPRNFTLTSPVLHPIFPHSRTRAVHGSKL